MSWLNVLWFYSSNDNDVLEIMATLESGKCLQHSSNLLLAIFCSQAAVSTAPTSPVPGQCWAGLSQLQDICVS